MKVSTAEKLGTVQHSLVLEQRTGAVRIKHRGKSRDEAGDLPADGERHNEADSEVLISTNLFRCENESKRDRVLLRLRGVRRYWIRRPVLRHD